MFLLSPRNSCLSLATNLVVRYEASEVAKLGDIQGHVMRDIVLGVSLYKVAKQSSDKSPASLSPRNICALLATNFVARYKVL